MLELGSPWPSNDIRVNRLAPVFRPPRTGESVIYWKYRHFIVGEPRRQYDVALFGDSSCLMSVPAAEIERLTGRPTVNLCMDASYSLGLPLQAMRDYLARRDPPAVIVLQASINVFAHGDSRIASTYVIEDQRYAAAQRWIATVMRGYPAIYKAGFNLSLSDLVQHYQLWRHGAPVDPEAAKYPGDAELGPILLQTAGFLRNPYGRLKIEPGPMEPRLSKRNAAWLHGIFELAEARQVPLLFAFNPVSELHRSAVTDRAFAEFAEEIRKLAQPYRQVVLAPELLRYYDAESAYDSAHMLGDGPERNAATIARWIEGLRLRER